MAVFEGEEEDDYDDYDDEDYDAPSKPPKPDKLSDNDILSILNALFSHRNSWKLLLGANNFGFTALEMAQEGVDLVQGSDDRPPSKYFIPLLSALDAKLR